MQRVFHVPSHLSYVSKLVGDTFTAVPSPSGRPLRVSDLLHLQSWDFFDVLHLHTVELADSGELTALAARLRETGKGFVFTLHDLVPNIEIDQAAFEEKTGLMVREASRVVTLTHAAARQVSARFGSLAPSVIRMATLCHQTSLPDKATGHVACTSSVHFGQTGTCSALFARGGSSRPLGRHCGFCSDPSARRTEGATQASWPNLRRSPASHPI